MGKKENFHNIFRPKTLHELFSHYTEHPNSLIYAGGTHIMSSSGYNEPVLPGEVIYLCDVEELNKIKRTEKYLEIGAIVPLSRLLSIGKNVIPRALYKAISLTGNPSIRNLATIGGNICVASSYSGIITTLCAMDALIELRSLSKINWIPIIYITTKEWGKDILGGKILTRIRIPYGKWNYQKFRKISRKKTQKYSSIISCIYANINKGILTDMRLTFGALGTGIFRNRSFEASYIGRKLPIPEKLNILLSSKLSDHIHPATDMHSTEEYRKATAIKLLKWYIEDINQTMI